MSKERLREAIDMIEKSIDSLGPVLDYAAAKRVLAAARAYACERCGGLGKTRDEHDGICHLCPDCSKWRRIADGGEG